MEACKEDTSFQVYRLFVQSNNASSVVWSFSEKTFIVFVSIYGKFVGMINFEAEIDKFPMTEDFWLGHTLICQNRKLVRMSWRDVIIEMCEKTGLLDEASIEEAKNLMDD